MDFYKSADCLASLLQPVDTASPFIPAASWAARWTRPSQPTTWLPSHRTRAAATAACRWAANPGAASAAAAAAATADIAAATAAQACHGRPWHCTLICAAISPLDITVISNKPLQVSTTATLKVGQWVRLWMRKPGNQNLRRRLLGAEGTATTASAAARRQQQLLQESSLAQQQRCAGRRLAQDNPFALPEEASPASPSPPLEITEAEQPERAANAFAIPLIYEDPYLQAAVEAAAEAETEYAEAAYARGPEPDEADAQSTDPAKAEALEADEAALLNPLGLEPIWLASARYGTAAMASEIADGDFPQVCGRWCCGMEGVRGVQGVAWRA